VFIRRQLLFLLFYAVVYRTSRSAYDCILVVLIYKYIGNLEVVFKFYLNYCTALNRLLVLLDP